MATPKTIQEILAEAKAARAAAPAVETLTPAVEPPAAPTATAPPAPPAPAPKPPAAPTATAPPAPPAPAPKPPAAPKAAASPAPKPPEKPVLTPEQLKRQTQEFYTQRAKEAGALTAPLMERKTLGEWVQTSGRGSRKDPVTGLPAQHAGIDMAGVPEGAPIYTPRAGKVLFAGPRGGYGNLVIVENDDGTEARYAHNKELLVKTGDRVEADTAISLMGSTGKSTGPHLHLELRDKNKKLVDPKDFFNEMQNAPVRNARRVVQREAQREAQEQEVAEATVEPEAQKKPKYELATNPASRWFQQTAGPEITRLITGQEDTRLMLEGVRDFSDLADVIGLALEAEKDKYPVGSLRGRSPLEQLSKDLGDAVRKAAGASVEEKTSAEQLSAKVEALQQKQREKTEAMRPETDLEAARVLAENLLKEETRALSPAKTFVERRTAELMRKESPEFITSGPEYDRLLENKREQARAELVQLYTEGGKYAPFVPADLLRGDPTWADENLPKALVDTYRAMGLRREVLPSGKIARVESVPGWLFNAALGVPSVLATTAIQNFSDAEEEWQDKTFADNLAARRDTVSYRIERDEQLQADLFSGDVERTNSAVLTLLPWMALEMIIPDSKTGAQALINIGRSSPKAAALTVALAKEMPRIAKEVAKATDKTGVFKAETKKVAAEIEEQAARRQAAKAERAAAKKAVGVDTAFEELEGLVAEMDSASDAIDALEETGIPYSKELAVRLRDEIKARVVADPEIEAFVRAIGAETTPLNKSMVDLAFQRRDLPDAELALADAGREKFLEALNAAEVETIRDARTRIVEGRAAPAVTRADVAPLPPLEAAEIERTFGSANVSPERARKVADARTLETLIDTLSNSPEEVRLAVAKRLGTQSYEDLKRLAAVDVTELEDAITVAKNDLQVARSAARAAQDNYDAAVVTPELMRQYAEARSAAVAADKALRAAEAASDAVRSGARDSVRAFNKAAAAYTKRLEQAEPTFVPSKGVEREGERITAMQDLIAERTSSRKLEQLEKEKARFSDAATAEALAQQARIARNQEAAQKLAAERRTIENSKTSQKDRDRRLEKVDERQTKLDEKIRVEAQAHRDRMLGYERGLAAKMQEIENEKASIRFRNDAELSELRKQREQLAVQTREEFRIYQEKLNSFLQERDLARSEMLDLQRAMDADIKKVAADLTAAQQKAALTSKAAAVTPRPVGRRRLAQVSETAKAHFAFAGYPVYARGYTGRPPMKYTSGKQAHLLHLALLRDHDSAAALGSYITGPEAKDFTQRAAKIPHVGAPLKYYETPRSPKEFYTQRVQTPSGVRAYDPRPDASGLPAQRALPTSVEYTQLGKDYWAWADKVAEDHPKLPRARSNSEYYHSLLAWSDPYSKPADVDLIRLRDQVFVADARKAGEVGPLVQPTSVRNADFVSAVREGFTGVVVGFRTGVDGKPVVRIQPMEWRGGRFDTAGNPVDVDPTSLLYMERGRKRTVLPDGEERVRPYTNAEWASVRALEDAQPGARSLRYSNDDLFMELAPPEQPTPRSFNYNPNIRSVERLFTPEELAGIKRDMGEDVRPLTGIKEGLEGDLQRQRLAEELQKRITAAAGAEQKLRALEALPSERARLERALSAVSAENADVAQRMGLYAQAKERRPLGAEILPERPGGDAFIAELDQLGDVVSAVNRSTIREKVGAMRESIGDFFRPAEALAQKSLTPVIRDIRKQFLGRMNAVSARLSEAALNTKRGARGNIAALQVAENDAAVFARSLREGTIANRGLIDVVAFAYVRDPKRTVANISTDVTTRLRTVVADWAKEGSDNLLQLRNDLLEATRDSVGASFLREASEGDVILAYPIALNGAWDATVLDMQVKGLARTKDQAEAASEFVSNLLDTGMPVGGRARAVEGQQVLAELMLPDQYRAPIFGFKDVVRVDLPETAKQPLVPARQRTALGKTPAVGRPEAVEQVVEILDQTAAILDSEVYVPRQLREALSLQMGKVFSAANASPRDAGILSARFWTQMAVLGAFTSRPNQFLMDYYGDIAQITAAGHPWKAAKTAVRSGMAQALGIPYVAQATYLTEAVVRAAGVDKAKPGSIARNYVAYTGFSPAVTAIIEGRRGYKIFGEDAADVQRAAYDAGVFESFYTGQLPAFLTSRSKELYGSSAFRGVNKLFEGNQRALRDMVNQAAARRRVAVMYSFMEDGLSSAEAARKAVEIVGDFAGELHPLEQRVIGWALPFLSYRKYAARRILRNLLSPFWMTRIVKGEEYTADILTAYMDDSDEFGLHTDSMAIEFDPEALYNLYMEYPGEDKDSDAAAEWVNARAQERNVPRAIERYERLVAKLRKDSAEKGRAQTLIDMKSDPDFKVLHMYYAPDPVKSMLPLWAQDRAAVFDNEHRSQAVAGWYNALVPRGDTVEQPRKDTIRFSLLPQNPFHSSLADIVSVLTIGALVDELGSTLVDATHPGDTALHDSIFGGLLEQPLVRTGAKLFMGEDIAETLDAPGTYLGPAMGPILYRMNLAETEVTTAPTGQGAYTAAVSDADLAGAISGKAEYKYTLPASVKDGLILFPPIAEVVFGALDIENTVLGLSGEAAKPMVDSVSNRVYNRFNTLFGTKTYRTSPSMQEKMAIREAEERIKRLDLPSPRMVPATPEVEMARTVSRFESAPPAVVRQALESAVERIRNRQPQGGTDADAYSTLLVRMGMSQEEVGRMTPEQRRWQMEQAVRDPNRQADIARAIAAPSVTR